MKIKFIIRKQEILNFILFFQCFILNNENSTIQFVFKKFQLTNTLQQCDFYLLIKGDYKSSLQKPYHTGVQNESIGIIRVQYYLISNGSFAGINSWKKNIYEAKVNAYNTYLHSKQYCFTLFMNQEPVSML